MGGRRDGFKTKESNGSTGEQTTDVPHWPLIRVTRLWDVLQRAKNWNELCTWFFNHAGSGRYQMYWKVPSGYNVVCGTPFAVGLGTSVGSVVSPKLPLAWSLLPKVKFVRLDPSLVEQVARQAYLEGSYAKPPIWADRFPGGLSVPDNISSPSREYEALPVTVELHIASAKPTSTNAWEILDVDPTQVFIGDSVYDHIQPLLKDAPNVDIDVNATRSNSSTAAPRREGHEVSAAGSTINDTPSTAASEEPQRSATHTDDPYELKGQAEGVYALYVTAERCARSPAFGQETNPKKRRAIAHEIFNALLDEMENGSAQERAQQKKLKAFFRQERLDHALGYMDPEYHPNIGFCRSEWIEDWPTAQGKAFLAQPDTRRDEFVKPMLAIIIGGVHHWIALKAKPLSPGPTKQLELWQWLEGCGLVRPKVLRKVFEIIAWNGNSTPQLPES